MILIIMILILAGWLTGCSWRTTALLCLKQRAILLTHWNSSLRIVQLKLYLLTFISPTVIHAFLHHPTSSPHHLIVPLYHCHVIHCCYSSIERDCQFSYFQVKKRFFQEFLKQYHTTPFYTTKQQVCYKM